MLIDGDPGALLQVTSSDASLDEVTLSTNTYLNNGAIVTVSGGLTLDNSTLRLNHSTNSGNFDQYVQLNFAGGVQTLGGTGTVELVNNRNDGYSEHVRLRPTADGELTIGAGITIKNLASTYFSVIGDAGLPLLIEGTIISQSTQSSNYSLQVTGSSVTNNGTFEAISGLLDVVQTPTNFSAGTLTGGTWRTSGGDIRLPSGNTIQTLDALVSLDGAGSDLRAGSGNALSTLVNVAAGGSLSLTEGNSLTLVGSLDDFGELTVGSGSTLSGTAVTIKDGGSLDGAGIINGSLTAEANASIAPGQSPGVLSSGDLDLQSGSILSLEIGGPVAGDEYDQVSVAGSVMLAGMLDVTLTDVFTIAQGQTFTIIDNDGTESVNGSFDGLPGGSIINVGGVDFSIGYGLGDGNDVVLTAESSVDVFTGAGGNYRWLDPANWSGGNLPTSVDSAFIDDLPGSPTIEIDGTVIVRIVNSAERISVTSGSLSVLDDSVFSGLDIDGGIVNLGRSNANSAGTVLNSGALEIGNDQALGNGSLTINGGTISADGAAYALPNEIVIGGDVSIVGTEDLTFSGPASLVAPNAVVDVPAGVTTSFDNDVDDGGDGYTLSKSGDGSLVLSGDNTFIGGLLADQGTLQIDGTIAAPTTISNGAILRGAGEFSNSLTIASGGTVAPGHSPEILHTGDFDLQAGSILQIEIGGTTAGSEYDQVDVSGTVTLGGTLTAGLINGFVPSATQSMTIINNDGNDAVVGTFAGLPEGATVVDQLG